MGWHSGGDWDGLSIQELKAIMTDIMRGINERRDAVGTSAVDFYYGDSTSEKEIPTGSDWDGFPIWGSTMKENMDRIVSTLKSMVPTFGTDSTCETAWTWTAIIADVDMGDFPEETPRPTDPSFWLRAKEILDRLLYKRIHLMPETDGLQASTETDDSIAYPHGATFEEFKTAVDGLYASVWGPVPSGGTTPPLITVHGTASFFHRILSPYEPHEPYPPNDPPGGTWPEIWARMTKVSSVAKYSTEHLSGTILRSNLAWEVESIMYMGAPSFYINEEEIPVPSFDEELGSKTFTGEFDPGLNTFAIHEIEVIPPGGGCPFTYPEFIATGPFGGAELDIGSVRVDLDLSAVLTDQS